MIPFNYVLSIPLLHLLCINPKCHRSCIQRYEMFNIFFLKWDSSTSTPCIYIRCFRMFLHPFLIKNLIWLTGDIKDNNRSDLWRSHSIWPHSTSLALTIFTQLHNIYAPLHDFFVAYEAIWRIPTELIVPSSQFLLFNLYLYNSTCFTPRFTVICTLLSPTHP